MLVIDSVLNSSLIMILSYLVIPDMKLKNVYISCGVNRSPNCLAWSDHGVAYASCNAVVLAAKADGEKDPLKVSKENS